MILKKLKTKIMKKRNYKEELAGLVILLIPVIIFAIDLLTF